MKNLIIILVIVFLFVNVASAEFFNPHEVTIISDAAGENTFPEKVLSYEEIVEIVRCYLSLDSADHSQEVDMYSVSLLTYTDIPQYCAIIILCNDPLKFATIYIDANTLEVIDTTSEDEVNQQKDYSVINDVVFEGDTLINYPSWKTDTCYTIPNGVKRIGDCAFDNANIECIIMTDDVVEIGIAAFEGCSALKEIVLSKNLSCIKANAFANCTSLTSINLPESLYCIGEQAFSDSGLSGVIRLPSSLLYVGDAAFYRTKLERVILCGDIEYADDMFYKTFSPILIELDSEWAISWRLSQKYKNDDNISFCYFVHNED